MLLRFRAVIATAFFVSLAGFAAQGSATTTTPDEQLLPIAATLLQLSTDTSVPAAPAPAVMIQPLPEAMSTSDAPIQDDAVEQPGDVTVYPTLAAAVAAQQSSADDEELRCLAGAIYFESRGEPLSGQLAVGEVILNRAASGRFAHSVCGVVTQPGQFSFVRGGRVPSPPSNADYRKAMAVAQVAMKDAWDSPAARALYFHARRAAPGWSRTRVASIGNHVFYR